MTDTGRPQTILYIDHTARVSGAEESLLAVLAHLDRDQFRPVLACPADGPLGDRARDLGVPVHHLPPMAFGFSRDPRYLLATLHDIGRAAWQLRTLVRREGARLVHCNSIRAGIVAACAPIGAPLVVHIRDHLPPGLVSATVRLFLHCRASRLIAVSRYTAGRFQLPATSGRRVLAIANGVDPRRFAGPADRAGVRAELGLGDAYPVIAVIGQLTPWKGQDDAIRALPAIVAHYPRAQLLIVGEARFTGQHTRFQTTDYARRLQCLVDELALAEHVVFTGQRDDVPAILTASDMLALPSWDEPFGLVVVEAMAAGKPVVATARGGPADVVVDGVTGFLVAPRDPPALAGACRRLSREPETARQLGARGKARAQQHFTIAIEAGRLQEVYHDLLARRPTRGGRVR